MGLELLVVALLVATIAYCAILNRRLARLRGDQAEFLRLLATFDQATSRAEAGVAALRAVSTESAKTLDERLDRSQALADDLAFLIERGARLAEKLEGGGRPAKSQPETASPPEVEAKIGAKVGTGTEARADPAPRSSVERDLFEALRVARGG